MSYTISDLKNDLSSILKGTTIDKVSNLYPLVNRAARELLLDSDPAETVRISNLSDVVYSGVYDYSLPADLKGNKIINIWQTSDTQNGKFTRRGREQFNYDKENDTFSIRNNSGIKSLRLSKSIGCKSVLNSCNSLTEGGTWSVGGDASNLTLDNLYYVNNGGSLNFGLSGAGTTGYIDVSLTNSIDLSDYEDIGAVFAWVYLPDESIITSITLTWGSDSSNYWEATATEAIDGAFKNGWNLVSVNWNGATETGTGDSSAIDYLKVLVTYDGTAETDIRVGGIIGRYGDIFQIEYYSKYLFADYSTSIWKEEADNDEDTINLDTDSYNLFFYKTAELVCQNVRTMSGDSDYYGKIYEKCLENYTNDNKSEAKKKINPYYTLFKR